MLDYFAVRREQCKSYELVETDSICNAARSIDQSQRRDPRKNLLNLAWIHDLLDKPPSKNVK